MWFDLVKTFYYFVQNVILSIVYFNRNISIHYTSKIKNVKFESYNRLYRFVQLYKTSLGKFTYIGEFGIVHNASIGKYCSIGPNVKIGLGKHPVNHVSTSPVFFSPKGVFDFSFTDKQLFEEYSKTNIGNDVWIGVNVVILDGVKIGDGAIIAAGAVVIDDVPAYSIYGGVPAKEIRKRFDLQTINNLQKNPWWELPYSDLHSMSTYFSDIDEFQKKFSNS